MKNLNYRIFKSLILIILIYFSLEIICGKILSKVLYNSTDGRYYKTIYSLERSNEDILIIGSSKAECNFVPEIFEKRLNLTCWNSGRGGQNLPFFRCMQLATLKRYSPKILILNIARNNLEHSFTSERLGFLRPFYWKHREIQPYINSISPYEKYYMYSNLYTFNSSFYYLFRSYLIKGIDGTNEDKGWKPSNKKMKINKNSDYKKVIPTDSRPINNSSLEEFEKLIKGFKAVGTDIYVVISPDFKPHSQTSTIPELEKLSKVYDFKLYNFLFDTAYIYKPELFRDFSHLNDEGAFKISNEISNRIEENLLRLSKIQDVQKAKK